MKFLPLMMLAIVLSVPGARAKQTDYLEACWNKQLGSLKDKYLQVTYTEGLDELYHSPEPWQLLHYTVSGSFWCNAGNFYKVDSLVSRKRVLSSSIQLDNEKLLFRDYGSKTLSPVTKVMFSDQVFESARYTPQNLLSYCRKHKIPADKKSDQDFALYTVTINTSIVRLFIRKSDCLVAKVTTLCHDDLRGDVLTTVNYADYATVGNAFYPATITIGKYGGRVKDTIRAEQVLLVDALPKLLVAPLEYTMQDVKTKLPDLHTEHYNNNIHFIDLSPQGSRVMVVEFKDFLLVSESPLNSEIGELVLTEIRKSISGKPIRFFAFSHHHPDYIGGMRPYIYQGATVLCVPEDEEYVNFLYAAPHALQPDSLQLASRPLKKQVIKDSVSITDGNYSMHVYHIGMQSGHTRDYCIFYFPQEKLLVEGDLVWIAKEGEPKKASANQAGLYQAIRDRSLHVDTVIQTWGAASGQVKMTIPFAELEQSVLMD